MEALFDSLSPAEKARFLSGPALQPPPGIAPQFVNPPNRNALSFGIVVTGTILAVLLVAVRLYTRIFCIKRLRLEDGVMIASLGLHAGFVYIAWSLYNFPGAFVHQWNVRIKDIPIFLRGVNTGVILYGLAMMLLKVSIMLDWIHMFALSRSIHRRLYYGCIVNIGIIITFYLACVLAEIFACTPRSKIWNVFEHGTCVNSYAIIVASSVFNFVLDLAMLAMPPYVIWQTTLSTGRKIAISAVFAVGVLACVCGALRIVFSIPFLTSPDKSYHVSAFALAATGEMTSGFFVLCVPSLPKLIKSTPALQQLSSKLQTWLGLPGPESHPNSRLGLPSWIQRQGVGRMRGRRMGTEQLDSGHGDVGFARDQESATVEGISEKNVGRVKTQDEDSGSVRFITMHEV